MRWISAATFAGLALTVSSLPAHAQFRTATPEVPEILGSGILLELSEVRTGQPGLDVDQFVEISGPVGTSLDGLQIVVVGDLQGVFPPQQNGGVEFVVDLSGTIGDSGTFVVAGGGFTQGTPDQQAELVFESGDNLTIIIADGFTGSAGDDLDQDDDGELDAGSIVVVDSVAVLADANPDGFSSDYFYSDSTVGPIAGFPPLHAWRCADTGAWRPGQDELGGDNETPGITNANCDGGGGGGPEGVYLSELRFEQGGPDDDEFFEIGAEPGQSLDGLTYIVIGDGSSALGSGVIEEVVPLDGYFANANGFFVVAQETFGLGEADVYQPLNHEGSDNLTIFLVTDFTGANGDDLDLDDDGVLDVTPWTEIVDEVSLLETCDVPPTSTEWAYSSQTVGPDGIYLPGGVYRCFPSGEWVIADFSNFADEHTPGFQNLDCLGGGCGGLDRSCFAAQPGPGCGDPVLCGLVCEVDPACCSAEWDGNCAGIASAFLVKGDPPAVELSEVRVKQPGEPDNNEFFELTGDPGESLDGLSIVMIGTDGCAPNGIVIEQFNLWGQTIPSDGYFVMGRDAAATNPDYLLDFNLIDAGNTTFLLAWNFTGARGELLDANGDCVLDSTPWSATVGDVVATVGDASNNCTYLGAIPVGPDDIYTPAHIYRCVSGDWDWSDFDPGLGVDSPGEPNPECGAPPALCGDVAAGSCFEVGSPGCDDQACCELVLALDPYCGTTEWDARCVALAYNRCDTPAESVAARFTEIRVDNPGPDVEEYIEVEADPNTSLQGVSVVVLGDGAGGLGGTVETVVPFGNTVTDAEGVAVLGNDTLTLGTPAYPGRFSLENSQNSTFLLVFGFTGAVGDDLDTDDDGVLDDMPWAAMLDSVSIIRNTEVPAEGVYYYASTVVGPEEDIDGNIFMPAHVWKCADAAEWRIGPFDPASTEPPAEDTPGVVNASCGSPCPADFNSDGQVDGADFGAILVAWGPCAGCPEDLNGDGEVSGADVGVFLVGWGVCP